MVEDMAESGMDDGIETGANCVKRQETEPAGAGYRGKRRRYRDSAPRVEVICRS
jgi:hypothetical protein